MLLSSSSSISASLPTGHALGLFGSSSGESDDHLLLCGEDAGSFSDEEGGSAVGEEARRRQREELLFPARGMFVDVVGGEDDEEEEEEEEEVVAMWAGVEEDYSPGIRYRARFLALPPAGSLDPAARRRAIAWILKVREFFRFQPATAYLAVNYMDRFLSRHALPQPAGGWPMQLLAVACLSLAAKMEETLVPSLLDLQVGNARFIFEPRTIKRMELLVLDALGWRLRSVTPFAFVGFFSGRADPVGGALARRRMASRAAQIILGAVEEIDFLDHCPSSMAAAAIICAAGEVPSSLPSTISPESASSWCAGLTTEDIANCHKLMQEAVLSSGRNQQQQPPGGRRLRPPPQMSATAAANTASAVLSASSSPSFSSSNKRRKLSSCQWVGVVDDGGEERRLREGGGIS